jgi:hypothetical protein
LLGFRLEIKIAGVFFGKSAVAHPNRNVKAVVQNVMQSSWGRVLGLVGGELCCALVDLGLVVIVLRVLRSQSRHYWSAGHDLLLEWSRGQGIRVIQANPAVLGRWPLRGCGQRVFRLTAIDAEGQTRTGWALCGGWLVGLFKRTVTIVWDDVAEPRFAASRPERSSPLWDAELALGRGPRVE